MINSVYEKIRFQKKLQKINSKMENSLFLLRKSGEKSYYFSRKLANITKNCEFQ